MNNKKSEVQQLKEKLLYKNENAAQKLDKSEQRKADLFCEGYKKFLDAAKTERESVKEAIRLAKEHGFVAYDNKQEYKTGDKVYVNNRGKALILAVIGKNGIKDGANIIASHIDAPRLDLKPRPLYEDEGLALFQTHYYGGIKKYQWATTPLSIHGTVILKNGESVDISIGENNDEPKFCVTDLLIHLAKKQMTKDLSKGIEGEDLNILVGSRPIQSDDDSTDLVKLNVIDILNRKYGIVEEDLISAELEIVPAAKACDVGLDRSLVGAYGHDDRVCAYTSLIATLEATNINKTVINVLADKEEIGSDGNTGLKSAFLKNFISDLAVASGVNTNVALSKSKALSADVTAAFDPTWAEPYEKNNSSYLNCGVSIFKYTGSGGKGGASDASAEFLYDIRKLLNDNNIFWQISELGKVDAGGGGTVAKYLAEMDIDILDVGVPVISMHSPFEIVSKLDTYMAYRAFKAFIER